ncbi:hypothetical protein NECID01_0153 [Nematocida sp. AWRm77]|nr:hypothetical protein NECID01_0153 [Nematocida sp. AWRm77]
MPRDMWAPLGEGPEKIFPQETCKKIRQVRQQERQRAQVHHMYVEELRRTCLPQRKRKELNRHSPETEKSAVLGLATERIMSREKSGWRYLSEGPPLCLEPCRPAKTEDARPLSLKKKHLKCFQYRDIEKDPEDTQCAICLQKYRKTSACAMFLCKHIFHKVCAFSHLSFFSNCPICRKDVISGEVCH